MRPVIDDPRLRDLRGPGGGGGSSGRGVAILSCPHLYYDQPRARHSAERGGLQTIVAEPWYGMTTSMRAFGGMGQNLFIETPLFDGQGNLLFVEVQGGRVMRLSPKQDLRMILPKNEAGSAGLAFLKDGRILVAGIGSAPQRGSIFSIRPDGSDKQAIVNPKARYVPNDIAMDGEGGFYHFAADMKTIPPIMTA